jgi:NAD+ kinase
VAEQVAPYDIPVLGINLGHLGFLSELEKADFELIAQLFRGEYNIENRMRIDVTTKDQDGKTISLTALNDAVISRGLSSKMLQIEVTAAGHYLKQYNADGIIVATPTGSTAYSLSAGGPIIEPVVSVLSVVPICPHALSARPLILSGEKWLKLRAKSPLSQNVLLSVDGKSISLPSDSEIFIQKSSYTTKLIRMKNRNFYDILRQKLS